VRVERVGLEDHGDVAILRRDVVDHSFADPDGAVADLFQAGEHPQGGGLAGPRRPDEDHELLVLDLRAHIGDDDVAGVSLVYVLVSDACHIKAEFRHRVRCGQG